MNELVMSFKTTCFMWQDVVEILFFATIIYFIIRWLAEDKTKNLIYYFYGICVLFVASYLLNLQTIETFLWSFLPVIMLFFIVMHQKTLQANFISLAKVTNFSSPTETWYTEVLRACKNIQSKKPLAFIIEKKQSLSGVVIPTYTMQAPIQNALIPWLLSCTKEPICYFWIDHMGYIKGIGTQGEYLDKLFSILEHTDAVILYSVENNLSFYLAEKKYEQLSTAHALQFLENQLKTDKKGLKAHETKKSVYESQL